MSEKLPTVVGEMGTAFNTTSVALIAAMTMMFSLFVCQRIERSMLQAIDRLVDRELLRRFEFKDPSITPFLSAEQAANDEALATINATLQRQIEVWMAALDSVFPANASTTASSTNWATGNRCSKHSNNVTKPTTSRSTNSSANRSRWSWKRAARQPVRTAAGPARAGRRGRRRDDFATFLKTLDDIARGEGRLVELQDSLSENLRVLHETQQIDKALHGLTAAIHLLTARHHQSGPHSAAA